jgi:hypothetical protein
VEIPDVRYARSGDVAIAYQVVGQGPIDLVFFCSMAGDVLSTWDHPLGERRVQGLASFSRVLMEAEGKLTGIGVAVGARVAAEAAASEVLVSGTVKDLVAGSGLEFEDRGSHELKGVPGEWRLYAVRES